jgi:flagellar hook-basal body complex protein FliE
VIPAISGAIGPLGPSEWSVPGVGSIAGGTAPTSGSSSFSGALSNAVDSLESTQADGTNAAAQLATGQLSDPTKAITAVENASLAMDLASQIRTKLVDATNQVFQTQV